MKTKNNKDYDLISSIMNDFKDQEEEQKSKNNLYRTFKAIDVNKYKKTILKETINETALDTKLDKNNKLTRVSTIYVTKKDVQKQELRETLKDIGLFAQKDKEFLILRKIPKISQQEYDNMKNNFINIETLTKLFNYLKTINCNFKSVACNDSIGGISPLTYLIESKYQASKEKAQDMKNKYDILQNFIQNYRTINGDGNCFYRAVMFRYLEILVLTKNIEQLQNVVFDFINSFKSEKLKSRMIIRNMNIKPDLSLKILILIVDLLRNNMVEDAHQILVKSFSTCQKFDYAMILYLRYLLYDYIRQNENKTYLKAFPIKIGNLLPYQFETPNGEFLFDDFYEKYLLNFFTDAEKIVIYLTPFVLQIEVDIIIFDDNEKEIVKSFKWDGNSELRTNEVISLLNHRNHYEIIYTPNDYQKYQKIFEIYENKQKPIILSDIEKYLKPDEREFNAMTTNIQLLNSVVNFEDEVKCGTVINTKRKKNNINKNNNNNNEINSNTNINNIINNNKIKNKGVNNMIRNTNNNINNNKIIQNADNKELNKLTEINQKNKNKINNSYYQNNRNNQNNNQYNINNHQNNGYSRNNITNRNLINLNNNNNQQQKYNYKNINSNNKSSNINENNYKINNYNYQARSNNSSNQNYENNKKQNNFSNQNGNNYNRLNENHDIPKTQNLPNKIDDNNKRKLNIQTNEKKYNKGVNQLSSQENKNQTNIIEDKNNQTSGKSQNLKKFANENEPNQYLNNTKETPTQNNDNKNKNDTNILKEIKKDKNMSNEINLNDNNNSTICDLNKQESKTMIKDSNQSNNIEEINLNSKTETSELKADKTLKDYETSKIEKDHKCMICDKIIVNNKNIDICKNCLKAQIYDQTYNLYLADISLASVSTKINVEQLELDLKKNEKKKKYLLPSAIKKYNEIFKDENLIQEQIINDIKKKICVCCAEEIKDESLELPCKCVLSSEDHLNEYLNKRDLIKEQCLCSKKYEGDMLFRLGSFIFDKNIDYKNKILNYFEEQLKGNCCICGKRYDITLEDVNYLTDTDNNYNEFLSNLNHNFCNDCYLLYTGKDFKCSICQVDHILPN